MKETYAAFRVHGVVQGVGYRWWCRRIGTALGLEGGVRNLPDGTVEVLARGPERVVDELGARLAKGPALARVESVERESLDPGDWVAPRAGAARLEPGASSGDDGSASGFRILS